MIRGTCVKHGPHEEPTCPKCVDIRQFIVDELKEHGLSFKDDYHLRGELLLAAVGLVNARYQRAILEELETKPGAVFD